MNQVLITGATGLVGSRLLPRLLAAGYNCRVLLRPGNPVPDGAESVEGDLLSPATLKAATEGVDAIVHLAALFRTPDEAAIWRVNLEGTRNLLNATAAHTRFILASTSLVYGTNSLGPGAETDTPQPTMAYPASKLAAEQLLIQSGRTHAILRLGFVYGDGDGHLEQVPTLATRMGLHPASSFSMVHHLDVANGVKLALSGAFDGSIINLVDDAPATLHEMAQAAGLEMAPSAAPLSDPWMGRADGRRARSLGFRPSVRSLTQAMEEGLL